MRRFVLFNPHTLWWIAFITYYLAVCLLHLKISSMVFEHPIVTPLGVVKVSDHMETILFIAIGTVALVSVFQSLRRTRRVVTVAYWLLWFATVLLARKYLLFHPNEYIHYPQYGILAILLALCMDQSQRQVPWGRILFWTTLMGALDEMDQYFYLCRTHGDYLDLNDMFFNLQGAQAGLLLYYGFKKLPEGKGEANSPKEHIRSFMRGREFKTAAACMAVILLLLCTGIVQSTADREIPPGGIAYVNGRITIFLERKPHIMGAFSKRPPEGQFYVLRPAEGLALLVTAGWLFYSCKLWQGGILRR
jgi:hypothetical protein